MGRASARPSPSVSARRRPLGLTRAGAEGARLGGASGEPYSRRPIPATRPATQRGGVARAGPRSAAYLRAPCAVFVGEAEGCGTPAAYPRAPLRRTGKGGAGREDGPLAQASTCPRTARSPPRSGPVGSLRRPAIPPARGRRRIAPTGPSGKTALDAARRARQAPSHRSENASPTRRRLRVAPSPATRAPPRAAGQPERPTPSPDHDA